MESLLIANRGEIACRIVRTARAMGIRTVVVHSPTDAGARHVREADAAVQILGENPVASYLDPAAIVAAAVQAGCSAIHPGYGFLSESPELARATVEAGLTWVGPSAETITSMSSKIHARELMSAAGVPVVPGARLYDTTGEAVVEAGRAVGYPLLVKAAAGGGGIGMHRVDDESKLVTVVEQVRAAGGRFFGDSTTFLERSLTNARHVEVQIFGTADGRVVDLGERDCSVQRRYQKIAEESPATGLAPGLLEEIRGAARIAGKAVEYQNAGTVEFLVAGDDFFFIEMNTRLQVEHPVTELVTGIDLVEMQLRSAEGEVVLEAPIERGGHSIELRLYAEDSVRFLPSPGTLEVYREPRGEHVRVDSGYEEGDVVTSDFDPLIAKLCVHAQTRDDAVRHLSDALDTYEVAGLKTNLPFLKALVRHEDFLSGGYDTGICDRVQRSRR
jgi:acetyl-CoA carboxylase biotin carboxylase subunit